MHPAKYRLRLVRNHPKAKKISLELTEFGTGFGMDRLLVRLIQSTIRITHLYAAGLGHFARPIGLLEWVEHTRGCRSRQHQAGCASHRWKRPGLSANRDANAAGISSSYSLASAADKSSVETLVKGGSPIFGAHSPSMLQPKSPE